MKQKQLQKLTKQLFKYFENDLKSLGYIRNNNSSNIELKEFSDVELFHKLKAKSKELEFKDKDRAQIDDFVELLNIKAKKQGDIFTVQQLNNLNMALTKKLQVDFR